MGVSETKAFAEGKQGRAVPYALSTAVAVM